jgi:nucleotide-binding universal stress UspA family protein
MTASEAIILWGFSNSFGDSGRNFKRGAYPAKKEDEMKKILCATDHSDFAKKAELVGAYLAKALRAELCYAYVSHITEKDMGHQASRSSVSLLKDVALQEHRVLSDAQNVARENGVPNPHCVLLRSHKIPSAVVKYAEKEGFDHIVIGSAGRVGVSRLILGSTASAIVREANCPVTVVR